MWHRHSWLCSWGIPVLVFLDLSSRPEWPIFSSAPQFGTSAMKRRDRGNTSIQSRSLAGANSLKFAARSPRWDFNYPPAPSIRRQTATPAPAKPKTPLSVRSPPAPPHSQTPIATSPRTSKNPNSPSSPQLAEMRSTPLPVVLPAAPPAADSAGEWQTRPPYPAKFRCAFPLRSVPLPCGRRPHAKAPRRQIESPAPRHPNRSPQSPPRIAPRIQKRIRRSDKQTALFLAACSTAETRSRHLQTVRRILPRYVLAPASGCEHRRSPPESFSPGLLSPSLAPRTAPATAPGSPCRHPLASTARP